VASQESRKEAFEWSSRWQHFSYEIKMQDGIEVICSVYGSEEIPYKPLKCEVSGNRPDRPKEQSKWGPAYALARLDTIKHDDILDFVNAWGLLGLWRVKRYQLADDIDWGLPVRPTATNSLIEEYSTWYHHPHKMGGYRWQEPVSIFLAAVNEFQEIISEELLLKNTDQKPLHDSKPYTENSYDSKKFSKSLLAYKDELASANRLNTEDFELEGVSDDEPEFEDVSTVPLEVNSFMLNMRINDCLRQVRPSLSWNEQTKQWIPGWQFASLLDSIYLRLFLDLQGNRQWRRCKREGCYKIFLALNPAAEYCSDICSNTQSRISLREKKWIENLCKLYPDIEKDWLDKEGHSIISRPGVGEKKLYIEMKKRVEHLNSK